MTDLTKKIPTVFTRDGVQGNRPAIDAPVDFSKLRYLVLDDSAVMREWMRNAIANMGGVSIEQSVTYGDAIYRLQNRSFDVVLCDYILADSRDGQQLLEECRRSKLIKSSVVWIMVTAENAYTQVFSAAELAPDDYILKPLKPDRLADRVTQCYTKKQKLKPATDLFDVGNHGDCRTLAEGLLPKYPQYKVDIQRILGDCAMALSDYSAAYQIFQDILVEHPFIAWARLGAARAYFHLERYDESQDLLEALVADNPDFLQSHDWLARIHDLRGNAEQAQSLLKEIIAKNPKALHRHREIARMALDSGDKGAASEAYDLMFKHGAGSSFVRPVDFCLYSNVLAGASDYAKLTELDGQLTSWYGKDPAFKFARASINLCRAKVKNDQKSMALHYREMLADMRENPEFPDDLKINMLDAAVLAKDQTTAVALAKDLVMEYSQNDSMTRRITQALDDMGCQEEAQALTKIVSNEMLRLNAKAVQLAKSGDMRGAAEEFMRLADGTRSLTVVLNAALAICRLAETEALEPRLISKLRLYLEIAKNQDPDNPKVIRLAGLINTVLAQKSSSSTLFSADQD